MYRNLSEGNIFIYYLLFYTKTTCFRNFQWNAVNYATTEYFLKFDFPCNFARAKFREHNY